MHTFSMHKPNIYRKTSKSSCLHHPFTEILLITMMFFYPYDILFSIYTMVSVIQLKMYNSRNFRFQIHIHTAFTNSYELIASFLMNAYKVCGTNYTRRWIVEGRCHSWNKHKIDELRPVCYFGPYWKFTFCGEWLVYA